ncbi:MAG: hypothetical protein C5B50_10970 [Verrucomicrobia bacterium]|nr:MAG: hypothetical protein C5B50_10970 [Verrucomicrobiota bacterium]
MLFEIYNHPQKQTIVPVRVGFSWPAFLLTWMWAFANRLWFQGILFLLLGASASTAIYLAAPNDLQIRIVLGLLFLPIPLFVGFKGNEWKAAALEKRGFTPRGRVRAASRAQALRKAAAEEFTRASAHRFGDHLPGGLQKIFAIILLTWKSAFRFRLFPLLSALLLLAVVALPVFIQDDGTARGFTQLLITYTLSAITALLGVSTLWLACGTLARDIEECQVQLVAVKPVARWQIWLGKWLGIMSLNAVLLGISGACVFALLQWRAGRLPEKEQTILRNEVLIARGSARPASVKQEIEAVARKMLQKRLEENETQIEERADLKEVEQTIREQAKAGFQVVLPGYQRDWRINLGLARLYLRDRPLHLRIKFNSAQKSPSGTFEGLWTIGVPPKAVQKITSQAPDTFHEFQIPPNLFDDDGVLTVTFANPRDNPALIFPLEEGIEVLYPESGFALNYVRGLCIILCWLALLAAIGLAAASFLSFPVSAFFSLAMLLVVFSTDTLNDVLENGTIMGYDSAKSAWSHSTVDYVAVPVLRSVVWLINLAKDFSPVDSLSTGRSISWGQLGTAFGQIVLLLAGLISIFGMVIFTRRELATAQPIQ